MAIKNKREPVLNGCCLDCFIVYSPLQIVYPANGLAHNHALRKLRGLALISIKFLLLLLMIVFSCAAGYKPKADLFVS